MKNTDTEIIITFCLYLAAMIAIGWYFYRRTKNLSDYILGGRGLNKWVTSLSAQASDMSGWLLMGLPGLAYASGLESLWMVGGLMIGTWINWKFIAKRLRIYTEVAGNSITLPDYLENRFRDKYHIIRIVSAVFILLFFTIYTSSGFVAGAKLFHEVLGFDYTGALITGVVIIIAYTFLGGFSAVSWTDLIQGLLMFIAIIAVPLIAIFSTSGFSGNYNTLQDMNPDLLNVFTDKSGSPLTLVAIFSMVGWGLGYYGQPHILSRFMAVKSPGLISQSRTIAMVWVIISLVFAVIIGMTGNTTLAEPLADREKVFMVMVNAYLPAALSGVFLSAILAAIMSTADSQLLVASSSLTKDFYALFRKNAGDRELVWISRGAVILVALIAFYIGLDPERTVLDLVEFAWGGFGAAFGPVIIFSLFWKRMTGLAALLGMISGGVTVLLWELSKGGIFDLYEIIPGFINACVVIVIVTLISRKPGKEITNAFEAYRKSLVVRKIQNKNL